MQQHQANEEKLKELIANGHDVIRKADEAITKVDAAIAKFNKMVKNVLYVGVPLLVSSIVAFLGSTYYNNNRVTTLEATRMTNDQLAEKLSKYSTKTEVIFLQNDLFELNDAIYSKASSYVVADVETEYARILKRFNGDTSRGGSNEIN